MKTLNKSTDSRFKMSKVALTVSAVILGSVSAGQAFAAEDKETEVIEVVGIRGGIIAGLDLKRNSDMIVDAVSSEDMGKFPDANLAEAMQRIPEVSIDRDGGEGRYVTIRGLGPEFNQVLLNGRKLASSEPTRAFSFDTIASELVSEMLVYKTQNAGLSEGGLGGTVDVRTARPLDQDGLVVAGSLKSLYEDNAESTNPQGSFLISNTFMDGKVGALFGATYQSRESRTYTVDNSILYSAGAFLCNTPTQYYEGTTYEYTAYPFQYTNGAYDKAYAPIELNRSVVDEDRSRLGLNGALQFRPNDQLDITVDYLYSKFEADKTIYTKSNWLAGVDFPGDDLVDWGGAPIGASQTEVDANGVVTQLSKSMWGGVNTAYNRVGEVRDTETQMFGINVDYMLNDDMKLVLDAAWSKAVDDNKGRNTRRSVLTQAQSAIVINSGANVPYIVEHGDALGQNAGEIGGDLGLTMGRQWNGGNDIEAENFQVSADLTMSQFEDWTINTGVIFESSKKTSAQYETPDPVQRMYQKYNRNNYALNGDILDHLSSGVLSVDSGKFGQPSDTDNDIWMIDVDAMTNFINDPTNAAMIPNDTNRTAAESVQNHAAYVANGNSFDAVLSGNSYEVEEEVTSFYIEGAYDFMLGEMEANLIAGIRYTHTNLEATGNYRVLQDLQAISCAEERVPDKVCLEPVYAHADDPDRVTKDVVKNSYDDILPSITLNLNLTDDLILRLASSESMTRPFLEDSAPKFQVKAVNNFTRVAHEGNEDLSPYKSFNLDASLEWYFTEGSMASIAAYHKTIKDYIVKKTFLDQTIESVATPEYQDFTVVKAWNANDVKINGISLNVTQTFDMGLGYQFNYTYVDTDTEFNAATHDESQAALPGLGDSLNLVGFYEKGPFAARIAYNKRFEFLRNPQYPSDQYATIFDEPTFADDYDQIDARMSLEVAEGINIFVEGINLTGSTLRQHGRYDNMFVSYEDFGKRYTLGVSGKF